MKTMILTLAALLGVYTAQAETYTIVTDGLHFVPSDITVHQGDTIAFDLSAGFTATEVSPTTYNLNGNKSLQSEGSQGAFDLEESGIIIMEVEGKHYFVDRSHNTTGMKGSITVLGPTGLPVNEPELLMTIYPNPTRDYLNINVVGQNNIPVVMDIFDMNGQKVMDLGAKQVLSNGIKPIDVSMLPNGFYVLEMTYNNKVHSMRFLKQ